jgi:hypothetical protein
VNRPASSISSFVRDLDTPRTLAVRYGVAKRLSTLIACVIWVHYKALRSAACQNPRWYRAVESHLSKGAKGGAPGHTVSQTVFEKFGLILGFASSANLLSTVLFASRFTTALYISRIGVTTRLF